MRKQESQNGKNTFRVMQWAKRQKIGDVTVKSVLRALSVYIDAVTGLAWPSQSSLAKDTELSDRTVRKAIRILEYFDIIKKQHRGSKKGGRRSDLYTVDISIDFCISKEEIKAAKVALGMVSQKNSYRKSTTELPEADFLRNTKGNTILFPIQDKIDIGGSVSREVEYSTIGSIALEGRDRNGSETNKPIGGGAETIPFLLAVGG